MCIRCGDLVMLWVDGHSAKNITSSGKHVWNSCLMCAKLRSLLAQIQGGGIPHRTKTKVRCLSKSSWVWYIACEILNSNIHCMFSIKSRRVYLWFLHHVCNTIYQETNFFPSLFPSFSLACSKERSIFSSTSSSTSMYGFSRELLWGGTALWFSHQW